MPVKLIKYLPHLVAALLLAAALGLAYRAGFQTAYHKQQVIIEQAEKDKSAALLASSRAFAAELERANARQQEQAEKTQQTGIKLAAANAEIGRLKQQYRKGIHHAIEQDNAIRIKTGNTAEGITAAVTAMTGGDANPDIAAALNAVVAEGHHIIACGINDDVVMWIKAYGKVTNAGALDASTLAADLQRKANRDEVAPKSHTHRAAAISDFAEAVAALTVHQKIGTFDICKLPDGTQIESGTVRIQNHNNNPTARVLTWPLAFVDAPVVVATVSAPDGNVRDTWVTIDSRKSNRSAVHYWLFEPSYNAMDVTINFVAVGRWK